jgi:hypothetical protein
MPLAAGDWICRSCWTSNRPQHKRCYRCGAQRGFDPATGVVVGVERTVATRGDLSLPPFLVVLPAIYLRLTVILSVPALLLVGLLFLFVLPAAFVEAEGWVVHPTLVIGILFALQILIALVQWNAAKAIERRRRWGYLVAFLFTAPQGLLGLMITQVVPPIEGYEWVYWITPAVYLPLAAISLIALLASLIERRATVTS